MIKEKYVDVKENYKQDAYGRDTTTSHLYVYSFNAQNITKTKDYAFRILSTRDDFKRVIDVYDYLLETHQGSLSGFISESDNYNVIVEYAEPLDEEIAFYTNTGERIDLFDYSDLRPVVKMIIL